MARARNIKPGFFLNPELSELPDRAKLLFIGIWCLCDSEGKMEWNPKRVRAELFPYDVDTDCTVLAQCLHDAGFIQTYVVDDEWYLYVPKFSKHQNTHIKEQPRGFPNFSYTYIKAPCEYGASMVQKLPITESPILKSESPIPLSGEKWEGDEKFNAIYELYKQANPTRCDVDEAYRVWRSPQYRVCINANVIHASLPAFMSSSEWKKDGGKMVPSFSKFLKDGMWRNPPACKSSQTALPPPEELF